MFIGIVVYVFRMISKYVLVNKVLIKGILFNRLFIYYIKLIWD